MTEYYLSIEKTGRDPNRHKIISIVYQELDQFGNPVGQLIRLNEWESSEIKIIQEFLQTLKAWNFIPIGFDLKSDFLFLQGRAKKIANMTLHTETFFKIPQIDLLSIAVLMNKGRFKGTSLYWLLSQTFHNNIQRDYSMKNFETINDYQFTKNKHFLTFYQFLKRQLPILWGEFQPLRE